MARSGPASAYHRPGSLAASLTVSIHTVLAGYQQLRDEGLIELRRGRGATVVDRAPAQRAGVLELARGLVDAARRLDMSDDEPVVLVRAAATPASRTS